MGTVISEEHLQRIEAIVNRKGKGTGKILAGGKRLTGESKFDGFDFSKGSFFPPTVISNVSVEGDLWREEVFGPVVVVKKFSVSISLIRNGSPLCVHRTKPKAFSSPTHANMGWARAYGRRTCPVLTGLPLKSKQDWYG